MLVYLYIFCLCVLSLFVAWWKHPGLGFATFVVGLVSAVLVEQGPGVFFEIPDCLGHISYWTGACETAQR